jgi:hypothetical protein
MSYVFARYSFPTGWVDTDKVTTMTNIRPEEETIFECTRHSEKQQYCEIHIHIEKSTRELCLSLCLLPMIFAYG